MEDSKQLAVSSEQSGNPRRTSQREIITRKQYVELSRRLAERARGGFSSEELATVNGFINYVADDVEALQQQEAVKWT